MAMGLYADHIFPWLLDHSEPKEMDEQRRLALRDVWGEVLEIGIEAALTEVREYVGVKHDADVAAACVRLIEEQGFQFTP
jgi:hypothetical protein